MEMIPTMIWDPSNPPAATSAIHPETLIHPVIQERSGTYRFQEMTATQWYLSCQLMSICIQFEFVKTYWPPAVGYAERNSASDAAKHRLHIPAVMNPHITLVDPPEGSARDSEAESAVHEFKMAKASPSIDRKEKFLSSSPLCPRASSCNSSAVVSPWERIVCCSAQQWQLHRQWARGV